MRSKNHAGAYQARRQRRIERRRHEIVTAAAQVFAEQGYTNATTKEIAAAADMAEGTLYNYFDGKHDILLTILREMQNPIDALLEDVSQLQQREDIVALVEHGFGIFVEQLDFTRTLLAEVWVNDRVLEDFVMGRLRSIAQKVQAFIEQRIEEGMFRPLDASLVTQMILGMVLALILPILRGKAPAPSAEERHILAENVVGLLLDGIRVRVFTAE
jgi:TetR/AcrR family fatty acid metabolism transcriptional regulator